MTVRSVRARVTLTATVVVAVVLVVAAAGLVTAQRRTLTAALEETVAREADALAAAVDGGAVEAGDTLAPAGDDDTVAQVVSREDGRVLAASTTAAGEPPVLDELPAGAATRSVDGVGTSGPTFLVVARPARLDGEDVVVLVGSPRDDVDESVAALVRSLAVGIPLVVLVLAGLVWVLVGRTLRPVEAIRAEVSEIGGGDLHRRVPAPGGDDEVARLARTMNTMLDRLEDASERQQAFVADASHELRSPLTRIRSELEVDLAHPEQADPVATGHSVLEEVAGLQALVDDLLVLARVDAGPDRARVAGAPVDLADVLIEEVHRLPAGGPPVATGEVGTGAVRGDRGQLARIVRNLLENAVRHARAEVVTGLTTDGGVVTLTVVDDGPGIPADRADEVFERFVRLDDARARRDGGTGLGLAIARELAQRHGGRLELDPDRGPGAAFVLTLPAG